MTRYTLKSSRFHPTGATELTSEHVTLIEVFEEKLVPKAPAHHRLIALAPCGHLFIPYDLPCLPSVEVTLAAHRSFRGGCCAFGVVLHGLPPELGDDQGEQLFVQAGAIAPYADEEALAAYLSSVTERLLQEVVFFAQAVEV